MRHVLARQLGQDLVLVADPGLQGLDLPLLGRRLPAGPGPRLLEHHRPLLEQLPGIEQRWLDAVLLADLRDRNLLDQVLPQDGHLLSATEIPRSFGIGRSSVWYCPIGATQTAGFSSSD